MAAKRKQVTVSDIFTDSQIKKAVRFHKKLGSGREFHEKVKNEIVLPALAQIDEKLGQNNDPDYLAYVMEYVVGLVK